MFVPFSDGMPQVIDCIRTAPLREANGIFNFREVDSACSHCEAICNDCELSFLVWPAHSHSARLFAFSFAFGSFNVVDPANRFRDADNDSFFRSSDLTLAPNHSSFDIVLCAPVPDAIFYWLCNTLAPALYLPDRSSTRDSCHLWILHHVGLKAQEVLVEVFHAASSLLDNQDSD